MHTSAHTPQLSDQDESHHTGVLLHGAEARTKVLEGEGHVVPVLCMDLELDNMYRNRIHVEQPFPAGHFDQARAAAHRLNRGTRVTVQLPIVGMSLSGTATHIHVINPTEEEQKCPA